MNTTLCKEKSMSAVKEKYRLIFELLRSMRVVDKKEATLFPVSITGALTTNERILILHISEDQAIYTGNYFRRKKVILSSP